MVDSRHPILDTTWHSFYGIMTSPWRLLTNIMHVLIKCVTSIKNCRKELDACTEVPSHRTNIYLNHAVILLDNSVSWAQRENAVIYIYINLTLFREQMGQNQERSSLCIRSRVKEIWLVEFKSASLLISDFSNLQLMEEKFR
jgi:hypothetical protein